ncbi:fibronectin type III domain-containing protein [Aquimarina algicola]|uniref:Fibronectin type III domain-containing protein n=1 Tax=Aquimarina algicola TaxID=2589995 RepID=A0A504JR92_9FLAO|nr:fibronectin type III domain-containing protein [Aquimarina algicola]TPN89251.1 fibronectin type III domain-containing protein [Aquimarina algicola]
MKRQLYFLFLTTILILESVLAQTFPVTIVPQNVPPAPIYFSSYADVSSINGPLRLQILLNDLFQSNREIRLKAFFEGNGIRFESNDIVVDALSLFIEGGIPLNLTSAELAPYFDFKNITGISPSVYGQPIPEGSYQFCFEVYDSLTGARISQKTCTTTYIFQNEPPILIAPNNKIEVREQNPLNLFFQWTPRHINVSNVQYELSIVEIWDQTIDPQAAFLASPPIFQTTTINTSYLYGPADPLLLSNKRYAWRVQAKALNGAEEIGIFNNNGFSEIFWFNYIAPCETPDNVQHEVKGAQQANITWEDFTTDIPQFTVRYREKGKNNEWFFTKTTGNWVTLWDLRPDATYEYQVSKKCAISESEYSVLQTFTTLLEDDEESLINCGISPDLNIDNMEPLEQLLPGNIFNAGDFPVKVTEVSGTNGRFTGKGYVSFPYFKNIKVAVNFTNIFVNNENELAEGTVITVYDPTWGNILDIDEVIDVGEDIVDVFTGGDNETINLDYDIDENDISIVDGQIVITKPDGTTDTFDYDEGDSYTITDANGDSYTIDRDGNISQTGQSDPSPQLTADNTDGIRKGPHTGTIEDSYVDMITNDDVSVTFRTGDDTRFALDLANNEYENANYPKISSTSGQSYYPAHKAAVQGENDIFYADIKISNSQINIDSLIIKTVKNTTIKHERVSGTNTFKITISGVNPCRTEECVVTYLDPSSNKYKIAANFFIHHIIKQNEIPIQVVTVNGGNNISNFEQGLNSIFGVAGGRFKVKPNVIDITIAQSSWDQNNNNIIDYDGSGLLSDYPTELKNIYQEFKKQYPDYDSRQYFIFVLGKDLKVSKPLSGFMPKARQWGFVFENHLGKGLEKKDTALKVAAHELGHGVFKLTHPFGEDFNNSGNASTWLMDYGDGTELGYPNWATMSDPDLDLFLFQDDSGGESAIVTNIEALKKFANKDGTFTFLSLAGRPITLPQNITKVVFSTGDTFKLNDCSDFTIVPFGTLKEFAIGKKVYVKCGICGQDNFTGYSAKGSGCSEKYIDQFTSNNYSSAIIGYPRISKSNTNIYFKVGKIDIKPNEGGYTGKIKKYDFLTDKLKSTSNFEDIEVTFDPDYDDEVKQFIANHIDASGFDGSKFYDNDAYVFIHATQLQEHQILKGCFKTGVPGEILKNITRTYQEVTSFNNGTPQYSDKEEIIFKPSHEEGASKFNALSLVKHWEKYDINYYAEIAKKVKDFNIKKDADASHILSIFSSVFDTENINNVQSDNWDCFWDQLSFQDKINILKAFTVDFIDSEGDYSFQSYYDSLREDVFYFATITTDDIGNETENLIYKIFIDADKSNVNKQLLLDFLRDHDADGNNDFLVLKGLFDMLNDEFIFDNDNPQLDKVIELINKWLLDELTNGGSKRREIDQNISDYDVYTNNIRNEFDLGELSNFNVIPIRNFDFTGTADIQSDGDHTLFYKLDSKFLLAKRSIDISVTSNYIDFSKIEDYWKWISSNSTIFQNNYSPYDFVILNILEDFEVNGKEFKRHDKIIVPAITLHWISKAINGKNQAVAARVFLDCIAIISAPFTAGASTLLLVTEIGLATIDIVIATNEEEFIKQYGQEGLNTWNAIYGIYNLGLAVKSISGIFKFKTKPTSLNTLANDNVLIEGFTLSTNTARKNAEALLKEGNIIQIKDFIGRIDDVLKAINSGKFNRVQNVTRIYEELLNIRIQLFLSMDDAIKNIALTVNKGNLVVKEGEKTITTLSKIDFVDNTISLTGNNIQLLPQNVTITKKVGTLNSVTTKSSDITTGLQFLQNGKMIAGDIDIVKDVSTGKYYLKPILNNAVIKAEVFTSATNPKNISWTNNIEGFRSTIDAKTIWNNVSKEHSFFIKDDYIIKIDNLGDQKTGNLVFGKFDELTGRGELLGVYEGIHNIDVVNDFGFNRLLSKLKAYHGQCSGGSCVNLNVSSGAAIISNPSTTTTIVGNYKRYPWFQGDMKELIPELLGDLKTQQFGPKKGGYNVLNVADEKITDWTKFWEEYNKPWLMAAINRSDDIWAASNPMELNLLFKSLDDVPVNRIRTPQDLADYLKTLKDQVVLKQITGFGNEVKLLSEQGYVYDTIKFRFIKNINNSSNIVKKIVQPVNINDLGKANINKFSLIDEAGNITGELKRVIGKGGKELRYFYTDFIGGNGLIKNQQYKMSPSHIPNYEIIDPSLYLEYSKLKSKDILYGDLQMPKVVNNNVSGLGKIMNTDAFKLLDNKVEIDGFYGLFKKDVNLYKDYGGESINLTKFKEALNQGMTKEQAAFETTIGKFAKEKGFNKVEFDPDFTIDNLDEVHIIFYK